MDFVPGHELSRFFPDVNTLNRQMGRPESTADLVARSVDCFRDYVLTDLPADPYLHWLESWDFSLGYVPQCFYEKIDDIRIDYDLLSSGLQPKISQIRLAHSLPAGDRFFCALREFVLPIREQGIGENLPDGKNVMSIRDQPSDFNRKETRRWKDAARLLAHVYREEVLGEAR